MRGGLRARREPVHRRGADGERDRLRAHGGVVRRDRHRGWPRQAEQLPRLPDGAPRRDAADRGAHRPLDRRAGRRRRAGHAADRTGGVQRDLRGDGEAGSQAADWESGVRFDLQTWCAISTVVCDFAFSKTFELVVMRD